MMRFQFSLEQILRLRVSEEQEWELRLAAASGECARLRGRIEESRGKKTYSLGEDYHRDFYYLKTRSLFVSRLDEEVKKLQELLVVKEEEREKVRVSYVAASHKRKILDKLKEKQAEEYRLIQKKKEIKHLDDITTGSWGRTRGLRFEEEI